MPTQSATTTDRLTLQKGVSPTDSVIPVCQSKLNATDSRLVEGGIFSDADHARERLIQRYYNYMMGSATPESRRVFYRLMADCIRERSQKVIVHLERSRGLR